MPLAFYSMSVDAIVIRDMIEDPTLDVRTKITSNGILYVKKMFFEETRSYTNPCKIALTTDGNLYTRYFIELGRPFDPSACSMVMSGSYAIDTFECYSIGEVSTLSNAGSGWNGLWDISSNYTRTIATEFFNYTSGSITGTDINGGTGWNNTGSIVTNA